MDLDHALTIIRSRTAEAIARDPRADKEVVEAALVVGEATVRYLGRIASALEELAKK